MEERDKTRAVHGRNARAKRNVAFHESRFADAAGCFVNSGLADDPFPLTPTLSLGEREQDGRLRKGMVPMRILRNVETLHEPSNEHAAPTELENDQGALAAIDMALLRSFANRFKVAMHVQSETNLS